MDPLVHRSVVIGSNMPEQISVVIPVYNASEHLRMCLERLRASTLAPLECIVVDDGSTDDSVQIALKAKAVVLSTGGRRGPAFARNMGARAARGDIVFFTDADVCVYPGSIARLADHFESDSSVDAVMGSYDEYPGCQEFLSQYRNLMHCYVHRNGSRRASTFWSGCGAIRRSVFFEFGGFDEAYGRPAIEDIELGYRLTRAGRKVILDKELMVTHLKRWTFWGVVKTDVFDRGIPWTQLILRDRFIPNDLNVQIGQRISVALSFLIFGFAALLAVYWRGYFLTPLFTALFFLLSSYWVESAQPAPRPVLLSVGAVVAGLIGLAYSVHMLGLIPLLLLGCLLLFVRHRNYLTDGKRRRTAWLVGGYIVVALIVVFIYLPGSILALCFVLSLLVLVILNHRFYLFLAKRGRLFALATIPFHLLYHFYNGIAFGAGVISYWVDYFSRQNRIQKAHPAKR